MDEAFKTLDMREPFDSNFYQSVPVAHTILKNRIGKAGTALDVDITVTGHAHIDVAWLWTIGQSRHKAGRSFYSALHLMEQFEDYHFTQSQPQFYDYIRQDYPELFEKIKRKVKEKRWEITGGMWVEADCNISGPESLARQFLLGRRFFREHFGSDVESPILWLPDVFGYSANLPQLMKLAGMKYFFTTKMSWNQYNRIPYDSFFWQGLDGTKILTHFVTTKQNKENEYTTYSSDVTAEQVISTWTNFQQKELHQQLLITYGHGDGGGGPTREMLENICEMKNFPALPKVHQGSALEFFEKLESDSAEHLPTWNNELYLEFHRGTYTTQSHNKRKNRKSEFLMHDTEFLATTATLLDSTYKYPTSTISKAWELVCLNQFHDIITGSSIGEVYADSMKDYEDINEMAIKIKNDAIATIAAHTNSDVLIINPSGFDYSDPILLLDQLLDNQSLVLADGTSALVQPIKDGTLIDAGTVKPFSITSLMKTCNKNSNDNNNLIVKPNLLENSCVQVKLNNAGDIISIYDKIHDRQVLPQDAVTNQFQAFEDRPLHGYCGDAWDIDIFFDDKMWLSNPASSIKVTETGPLRATIEIHRQILDSQYIQRISLVKNSPRIDFHTEIDWKQKHILLKCAFPAEIISPTASYEIPWGHVERPTHNNTSWDWAKFEVCAQKWVDLSEGNYGISLLNDSKYGHDIKNNVARISLLRSTTGPDPDADQGFHQFKYSLLPHSGKLDKITIASAYRLNDTAFAITCGQSTSDILKNEELLKCLITSDSSNIVIETIKKAEDNCGIIVRCYESLRNRNLVTFTSGFKIKEVWRTNLLEENETRVEHYVNQFRLTVKPFEIITLRLIPVV